MTSARTILILLLLILFTKKKPSQYIILYIILCITIQITVQHYNECHLCKVLQLVVVLYCKLVYLCISIKSAQDSARVSSSISLHFLLRCFPHFIFLLIGREFCKNCKGVWGWRRCYLYHYQTSPSSWHPMQACSQRLLIFQQLGTSPI